MQANFSRLQNDLQTLATKIGELESEAEEHELSLPFNKPTHDHNQYTCLSHRLVLTTLNETLSAEPDRKCFRLIGGVLVERTVKDVVPALETNRAGVSPLFASAEKQLN